jgi:hypothetical protein
MNLLKKGFYFLLAATVLVACSDDDDAPVGPIDPGGGGSDHPLAGTSWSIAAEEGSLGVGPSEGNYTWWATNMFGDDVTARACLWDDVFTFNADGSYSVELGTETWIEAWQNADVNGDGVFGEAPGPDNGWSADEGCHAGVAPHTSKSDHTWTANSSTITVTGDGAFIGVSKVHNSGEDGNPSGDTITYNYTLDGDTLEITISGFQTGENAGATWYFKLLKQ